MEQCDEQTFLLFVFAIVEQLRIIICLRLHMPHTQQSGIIFPYLI